MADRTDPYRNFRFRVELDGIQSAAFSEATIPDSTTDPVDYREGTDPTHQKKLSQLQSDDLQQRQTALPR